MSKSKAVRRVERADLRVAKKAAKLREDAPVKLLGQASELADQPQLATICLTTLAAGLITRDARLTRTGGRMFAALVAATMLKSVVKHVVDRTRPSEAEEHGYRSGKGREDVGPLNSFPSGHTAGATAVARALRHDYPASRWPAAIAVAGVGGIQLPRGRHYATDIAAGLVVGWVAEAVSEKVFERAPAMGQAISSIRRAARRPGRPVPS